MKLTAGDVTDDVLPVSKSIMKLDLSSDSKTDDGELIDEEDLLTEEDLKAPELPGKRSIESLTKLLTCHVTLCPCSLTL